MNEAKRFVKSTAAYFLGNVLSKAIVFFMLPLYTAYIPPASYGYYDLTVTYVSFFSSILFLDIWSGVLRFMYDSSDLRDKLRTVYSGGVIYGGSLLLYFLSFSLLNAVMPIDYFPLVLLYGLMITVQNWYGYIARGLGKNVLFAISGVVSTLLTVALNVLFIVGLGRDYSSLYLSASLGVLAQTVMLELSVRLIPRFRPRLVDRAVVGQIFRFSLPLCLNSVAFWFLTSFNRVMIVRMLGDEQNGFFAIASKFSVALNLVGTCFTLAWQETAYQKEGGGDGKHGSFYSAAGKMYLKFLFAGLIFLTTFFGVIFKYMVGADYASARALVPLGLLGTVASLYSAFLGNVFSAIKKTGVILLSTLAASAANVAVLLILLPRIGLQAANISLIAGFFVNCLIRVLMLRRYIGLRFPLPTLLACLALFAGAGFAFVRGSAWLNFGLGIAEAAVILYVFRGLLGALLKKITPSGGKPHA